MELFLASIFIFLTFLVIKAITKTLNRHRLQSNAQAPGPKNLPIIGSIHHLLGRRLPHRALCDLSLIYGPIMRLKLGEIHTVIISSADGAKEIMQTHDINFASRPITPTVDALFYNGKGLIFASYGEFWRQMRRICTMELLSSKRVRSFRAIISQEVSHLMRSINAAASIGVAINLSSEFANLSNNIMAISVVGGRCEDQKLFQSALRETVELVSGFSMIDLFPSMPNFITRIFGLRQKLERCWLNLDRILEKIVKAHIERRAKNSMAAEDLTDVLLRIQQDDSLQFPLLNDNIKAVINDILMAGSETTATTLEWAISELVLNPKIMKKAQREVREVFGYDMTKIIGDEEWMSNKLSYLQLVIKETLRLHTPVPLLLPRENKERCKVMGYDIPVGTTVIVNAWAIARDPKYWDEPQVFRPERFEENHIDMKGAHFEMIPFGAGRRICPGMHFALATVEMALAYLLYYFDWECPAKNGEELDMSEAYGISIRRKLPLCLLATPCAALSGGEDSIHTPGKQTNTVGVPAEFFASVNTALYQHIMRRNINDGYFDAICARKLPTSIALKEMLGREPTLVELHNHTHKRHEDQQWIDERARKVHEEYTRLRESHAVLGEGFYDGSVEYSEYRIWLQAVGGIQHGRVYDLVGKDRQGDELGSFVRIDVRRGDGIDPGGRAGAAVGFGRRRAGALRTQGGRRWVRTLELRGEERVGFGFQAREGLRLLLLVQTESDREGGSRYCWVIRSDLELSSSKNRRGRDGSRAGIVGSGWVSRTTGKVGEGEREHECRARSLLSE
ncbi:Cytochrome P450 71D10 [Dendrobium catenatum]|uniref:Cytochrome P450 71D10 n=1 Tax=Dendrobium catenatum TaxID=906689 RepID=A0A2I0WY69_9ASPA|nr:Cytochrome P450 71D10 [Dendrobium catenatum]